MIKKIIKLVEQFLAFLKKHDTNTPDEIETSIDYGYGFEAKKLVDGNWVLMRGDYACDLCCPGYCWQPGSRFYKECMGSKQKIDSHAKAVMAAFGVF
jgi:hypothetical protein